MSTFTLDLSKFGAKAIGNAEKVARKIGLDMHSRIVERMPVDTGRARTATGIAIGGNPGTAPAYTSADQGATSAMEAKAQGAVSGFRLGDSITIFNNVEYIGVLEFGRGDGRPGSPQAPNGMFRITFNEIASKVGAIAAEVNR